MVLDDMHNKIEFNSKGSKDMATEITTKIADSDHPTVVWGPLTTESPRISAWAFLKVDSLGYISAADSMGIPSFNFLQWTPKDASFVQLSAVRLFKVIQGRWFWDQLKGYVKLPVGD